ncbi:MMPL family transporter [Aquiluna sp. KACHI24]|uniref:MMPL family transporter n=1 Tax=Aquiluna sp. KACHI24 TaxID=2968831 RepID=UPI002203ECCA|nr:MMPL family transporter [Aquiluna sp. KACHI24]BDQ00846.1 membrane protein [Aquiluna sp. KACHI24]
MNLLLNFITGRKTAWVTLLIGLVFAGMAFGPLRAATTETAPTNGLPSTSETALVNAALETLPGSDATAAVLVYKSESKFTDDQLKWLQGEFDPMAQMPVGGVNEKFLEFTNLEIQGQPFVPPAQVSEDGMVAVVTVPLEQTDEVEVVAERAAELRELAKEDMPSGLEVYLTGPEGFQADLNNVFAGADFTLLLSTVIVVAVLLLVTYRSPVLWLVPLLVVGVADGMAGQLGRQVATLFGMVPDGSVTGILSVLVFGAGTNYALLLIARYREELLLHEDRYAAMRAAVRGAGPAILASGGTVTLALLTLTFAELGGNRTLGLVCATGIIIAMISALLVLPAALVVFGRGLFWPFVPKFGGENKSLRGLWGKLGKAVSKRPAVVSVFGVLVLIGLSLGSTGIQVGLSSTEQFREKPEAVFGQEILAEAFPAGATTPTNVIVNAGSEAAAKSVAEKVNGVAEVAIGETNGEVVALSVVLDATAGSEEAYQAIRDLRTELATLEGADALVGGLDAEQLDVKTAYENDQLLVIPLILLLVFLVLVLLLRSLLAPVLLLATVVASFFAAMGASWLIFQNLLGLPALDLSVFLYAFLFLVALGVDYNIFLVSRAQEEAVKHGTREGMVRALSATGGVITSAGILLAAVFAVLGVLPLIALYQIGIIVCIGVLLDTLLVRTVIVPALAFMTGDKFWWPRKKLTAPKFG